VFNAKATPLDDMEVIRKDDLEATTAMFKGSILLQLEDLLQQSQTEKRSIQSDSLMILSIIEALEALGLESSKLVELENDAKAFSDSFQGELQIGKRLDTFIITHKPKIVDKKLEAQLGGDVSTVYGRQSILEKTWSAIVGKSKQEKLKLLKSIFGRELVGLERLDKLLAAREVIKSIEGIQIQSSCMTRLITSRYSKAKS